jgi:hypothetical protein
MEAEAYGDLFTGEYPYHRGKGGIGFWAHETGSLSIIKEEGNRAIIREGGHQYFSGRGEFPYTSPRYYVGVFCMSEAYGTGKKEVECFTAIYSIEYTRATASAAKQLAEELYETLKEES